MPLGPGVRYRRKGKMRLAFKGNEVVEAKNMKTGAVHTESEFAHDKKDGMAARLTHLKKMGMLKDSKKHKKQH